ncbi:lysostaphin resistance A-like protein [Paenibacillus sp. 1781tsa1]|uniref:CPBP family intramembrane glutamic endopeptidase n=1 Tax=Paenibacillus sp. 1781tsa1 TaxID=2953810 RepID=UPI0034609E63
MKVLLLLPTILLVVIIRNHKHWITHEKIKDIVTLNFWRHVFYATALSFMGFNIITSLTSSNDTTTQTIISLPIVYVYSILFSPLIEELICRKFVFGWLDKRFGFIIAALMSSLVFAIPHFSFSLALGYIWLGLVWSWHYKKSENILVTIVSHSIYNYITILLMSMGG